MKRKSRKESNSLAAGILGFLSDQGKTSLLSSVTEVLDEVVGKTKQADKIIITSAVPLSQEELQRLGKIISGFLKKELPVTSKVDKKLIGGFSIRVGDFFLDASLHGELENIKHVLTV